MIAEDVAFQWALRRLGRRHGRRLGRLPSVKAVASTRKFDQHGDWHYFALMTRVAFGMLTGRQVATDFIRSYWYQR